MAHVPAQPASPTPVFSDPTGRRVAAWRRLAWAFCAAFGVIVVSVAFTLATQVPLPGLGGLLPDGPDSTAPRVPPEQQTDTTVAAGEAQEEVETLTTAELETRLSALARPAVRDRNAQAPGSATGSKGHAQSTPAATGAAPTPVTSSPGTPSENANPQATTKARNPQAAPKKPSPRVVREPSEHAASGQGKAKDAEPGVDAAPGRNK